MKRKASNRKRQNQNRNENCEKVRLSGRAALFRIPAIRLAPKVVIPCHYKTPKCGFDIVTVDPFVELFDRVNHVGDSCVELNVETLPNETECAVLDMLYG